MIVIPSSQSDPHDFLSCCFLLPVVLDGWIVQYYCLLSVESNFIIVNKILIKFVTKNAISWQFIPLKSIDF